MKPIGHRGRLTALSAFASALVLATLVLAQPATKPVAPGKAVPPAVLGSAPSTAKVLIPKPGGPALATGPRQPAPPQPVAMAAPEVNAIVAKVQAAKAGAVGPSSTGAPAPPPLPRLPFEIKPGALAGSGPQGAVDHAGKVTVSFAQFVPPLPAGYTYSSVEIWGIPDGAWFVDCSVETRPGSTSYEVVIQGWANGAPASSSDAVASMPAAGPGHVALGLIYLPGAPNWNFNTLQLRQTGPWIWYGCSFKPV